MTHSAEVVKNYGLREQGGFGVRCFRVFCPECGFLSDPILNVMTAQHRAERHQCASQVSTVSS